MKRSKANAVAKARHAFSLEYECVSIAKVDADGNRCDHKADCLCEDSEEYFSHSGCDVCPHGLAATVIDVVYLSRADVKAKHFDNIHEGSVCSGCLCSLVNGDDSDLDYSVDDEDCPTWTPDKGFLVRVDAGGLDADDVWLPQECIDECSASGAVDDAVAYWLKELDLRADPKGLKAYLKGYGAWDDAELSDHDQNLKRLLWLWACDASERQTEEQQ